MYPRLQLNAVHDLYCGTLTKASPPQLDCLANVPTPRGTSSTPTATAPPPQPSATDARVCIGPRARLFLPLQSLRAARTHPHVDRLALACGSLVATLACGDSSSCGVGLVLALWCCCCWCWTCGGGTCVSAIRRFGVLHGAWLVGALATTWSKGPSTRTRHVFELEARPTWVLQRTRRA